MKSTRELNMEREKFTREMEDARDERKLEVAFHAAHPQYSPEEGKALAAQFVVATLALTAYMEADFRGEKQSTEQLPTHVPYWEIKSYLTDEQRAVLAAAHARVDRLELEQKAKSYDDLLETLNRCGLAVDRLLDANEDFIAVENLKVAKAWFDDVSANAYEDGNN